jgi:ubiquinone/menaquinone biosynthesis C-methylase UbiE
MVEMNWVARYFVNTLGRRRNSRRWTWIQEHLSLAPGATCLEIGPGNASMATLLVEGFAPRRYLAMDLDARQIDAARGYLGRKYSGAPPGALALGVADMLHLPLTDRSVDVAFAFVALHHASPSHRDFSQLPRALAEIDRTLRPGGHLVYEEFVHKEKIRRWLGEHGFEIRSLHRGWSREMVVARKTSEKAGGVAPPESAPPPNPRCPPGRCEATVRAHPASVSQARRPPAPEEWGLPYVGAFKNASEGETAVSASGASFKSRWKQSGGVPQPDTPGGMVLALALGLSVAYVILFIADYSAMARVAWFVTSLSLVLAVFGAFALSGMLGSDIGSFQRLELDLARTVLAYSNSGSVPGSDAPLSGVWRAYVGAAEESRRMARAHAYALGPFIAAGALSLAGTLLAGLALVTSTINVAGFAMFIEMFAFAFLVVGAGTILLTVGYSSPVPGFAIFAARRWRRNSGRQQAVEEAIGGIPWLAEFIRSVRESYVEPIGPSVIPSWRE